MKKKYIILSILFFAVLIIITTNVTKAFDTVIRAYTEEEPKNEKSNSYNLYLHSSYPDFTKKSVVGILKEIIEFINENVVGIIILILLFFILWHYWLHNLILIQAEYKNNPNDYDGHIFVKSRIIDPLFLENAVLKRLSEADDNWKDILKQESVPKEYFVKFDL